MLSCQQVHPVVVLEAVMSSGCLSCVSKCCYFRAGGNVVSNLTVMC
jgi:hypothetical protein